MLFVRAFQFNKIIKLCLINLPSLQGFPFSALALLILKPSRLASPRVFFVDQNHFLLTCSNFFNLFIYSQLTRNSIVFFYAGSCSVTWYYIFLTNYVVLANRAKFSHVLQTSVLALCYSAAEYCAPVWSHSEHTKLLDSSLNECVRLVTGCIRSTPTDMLPILGGVEPAGIGRKSNTITISILFQATTKPFKD